MRRYAILRNLAATKRTASPFENVTPSIAGVGIPAPQFDVHPLSNHEVVDVARDPQVRAIAPIMPTALIEPFDAGAAAVSDAWGINAVKADVSSCSGDGVTVAVLDTGIDKSHPAFNGVEISEEDFSGSGNGDRQGHGTPLCGNDLRT